MNSIDSVFNTENKSVIECFQRPGLGYYIPLYQRDYSWDISNIEQLLDDITNGVEGITLNHSDNFYRFLGTIITVIESNKNNIQPQDSKALPTSIEKVIDGQQRLTTITIFSVALFLIFKELELKIDKSFNKFPWESEDIKSEAKTEIESILTYWKNRLKKIFGLDLEEGIPTIKPKIIRGNTDKWILKDIKKDSYNSPISKFLSEFIEYFFQNEKGDIQQPLIKKDSNVEVNFNKIYNWLSKTVCELQKGDSQFISSVEILKNVKEDYLWKSNRRVLTDLISDESIKIKDSLSCNLSSLIKLCAVSHFLLDRCCFTIIKPANDEWAFDMFQSLNATGTPLTAIETFKPIVVQFHESKYGSTFKDSDFNKYFSKIEDVFKNLNSASDKNKHTNLLLTSIAIPIEGIKLQTYFSAQRKWLNDIFEEIDEERKLDFIKFFGNYSNYYKTIWQDYKTESKLVLDIIKSHPESELISTLLLFLIESKHNMSITVLGSLYCDLVEGKDNSVDNFVNGVKYVSAFYILWRSIKGNTGLDEVYREYFRGKKDENLKSHKWVDKDFIDIVDLKNHLYSNLPIRDKSEWLKKAEYNCTYDKTKSICKLLLYLVSTDTIPDDMNKGLIKNSKNGVIDYMTVERWKSNSLKTLEHVAPQNSNGNWDVNIYSDDTVCNFIGNLTVLPININSSVGNKVWIEKLIYYKFVNLKDESKNIELHNLAKDNEIQLNDKTLDMLINCQYSNHIESIASLEKDFMWDRDFIIKRTKNILSISFDRIETWIK